MQAFMKYSIIMNTINRSLLTKEVFEENIRNSGVEIDNIQILINDNGSTEAGILDWASKVADVHLIQGKNIGNSQGLNLLMENVTGDIVAKLDNDILLKRNWLKDSGSIAVLNDVGLIGFHWGHKLQDYNAHATTKVGVFDAKVSTFENYIPIFGSWCLAKKLGMTLVTSMSSLSMAGGMGAMVLDAYIQEGKTFICLGMNLLIRVRVATIRASIGR